MVIAKSNRGAKKNSLERPSQKVGFTPVTLQQQSQLGWGSVGTRDRSKSNRSRWQSWNEDQEILNSRNYDSRFGDDVEGYGIAPTVNYSDIPFNNYQDDIHQLMTGYYHR